jgi:hypothetical protein
VSLISHVISSSIPLIDDSDFFLQPLDSTLFPGVPSTVKVHNGFADSHAESAPAVLAAVKKTLAKSKSKKVVVTGHSLGAALALIDTLYLTRQLGASAKVRHIGYGLPRVSLHLYLYLFHFGVLNTYAFLTGREPSIRQPRRYHAQLGAHQQREGLRTDSAWPIPWFPPPRRRDPHPRGQDLGELPRSGQYW